MVERDRDTTGSGTLSERLYAQQDANWNVTAIVSTSGTVQERYLENPYGQVTVLASDWSSRSSSSFGWIYFHEGGRYDSTSGFYNFRNRDYSPAVGRWLENDPAGLFAGDTNLYRFVADNPSAFVDPSGLVPITVHMDAFIGNNIPGGPWYKEPGQIPFPLAPTYYFKGDDRGAGGDFEASRLRSWFTIDSNDVGNLGDPNVQTQCGVTIRGIYAFGAVREIAKDRAPATQSYSWNNGALGKCTSSVTVTASGSYPFIRLAPSIDYTFVINFWRPECDEVAIKISYNHNQFPDYEVVINNDVAYYYPTQGTGPGIWNLALGPNVKGVQDYDGRFPAKPCC